MDLIPVGTAHGIGNGSARRHGSEYVEALRSLAGTLDHVAAGAGVRPGETIHDARRRNFDHAAAEARARDARR